MNTIASLLDVDFYKFTMGQFAFLKHPDVKVKYSFTNRNKNVRLAKLIDKDQLKDEFAAHRSLTFSTKQLQQLGEIWRGGKKVFHPSYLAFLKDYKLPEIFVDVVDDQFVIETSEEETWANNILWETIVMSTIAQFVTEARMKEQGLTKKDLEKVGTINLLKKVDLLKQNPGIKFMEFGTRRRAWCEWQSKVDEILANEVPNQLIGASSVHWALHNNLAPAGTLAHEMLMVYSGIYREEDIAANNIVSHNKALEDFYELYGPDISVALTDTWTTDWFFRNFNKELRNKYKNIRQDSGNPILFAEKALSFYRINQIDALNKNMIFSDGLDIIEILQLCNRFNDNTNVTFGWGTDLTNDVGLDSLSIVMKATKANGHHIVKLSDNPDKASGDPETIELYKRLSSAVQL